MNDALQLGALSAAEREIVALAGARFNDCGYCLSAHTLLAKGAGLSPEAIADARRGGGNAIAVLAQQIAQSLGRIGDADLAAARAAGLDDAKIVEVVAAVALYVLTNYLNNVVDTEIDFPVVEV